MNIGDVLYNPDHVFADGGHANKIFIIVSDHSKEKIVLVIVTSHGATVKIRGVSPRPRSF